MAGSRRAAERRDRASGESRAEPLDDAKEIAALPGEREAEGRAEGGASSSTPQVMLKNGAPTVIFSPVSSSSASG